MDIQLVELQHVIIAQTEFSARSFQSPNYGLTIRDRIAIICAEMDLHRRYIDDKRLRESIHEATLFLRPYGGFEEELNETTTGIARNIVHWLTPMIQAHIMDEELPPEPSYVEDYREAHNKTKALWDNFWHRFDQSQAPKDQRDSE